MDKRNLFTETLTAQKMRDRLETKLLSLRKQRQFDFLMKKRLTRSLPRSQFTLTNSYEKFIDLLSQSLIDEKIKILSNKEITLYTKDKTRKNIYDQNIIKIVINDLYLNTHNEEYITVLLDIIYICSLKGIQSEEELYSERMAEMLIYTIPKEHDDNVNIVDLAFLIFGNLSLTKNSFFKEKYVMYIVYLVNKETIANLSTRNYLLWNIRIYLSNNVTNQNRQLMISIVQCLNKIMNIVDSNQSEKVIQDIITNLLNTYLLLSKISNDALKQEIFDSNVLSNIVSIIAKHNLNIENDEYAFQFLIHFFTVENSIDLINKDVIDVLSKTMTKYKSCCNDDLRIYQILLTFLSLLITKCNFDYINYIFNSEIISLLFTSYIHQPLFIEDVLDVFVSIINTKNKDYIVYILNKGILSYIRNEIQLDRKNIDVIIKLLSIFHSLLLFYKKFDIALCAIDDDKVNHKLEQLSISNNEHISELSRECYYIINN